SNSRRPTSFRDSFQSSISCPTKFAPESLIGCIFILLFITISIVPITIVDRGVRKHGDCFGRRGINFLSSEVSGLEHDVLDRVRGNLPRILLKNDKVSEFTGSDGTFDVLLEG